MSRIQAFASAILFASILGCGGPEKELPKDIGTASERGKEEEVVAPVPGASQPDAAKLIAKCIAAATEGHPERLERAKANRLTEQGRLLRESTFVPTRRKIAAVWPDRFYFADESNVGAALKISIGLRQQSLTFRRNDEAFDPGLPKGYEQILHVDGRGLHWMSTLVPLADPKTILFGLKKQLVGNQNWDTVQVSLPACPIFTVWFDESTNLLGYVSYIHAEGSSRLNKRLAVSGHKPFAGVQLPMRIEFERNGLLVESWSVSAWEFPEKIEDAVFDQTGK